MTFKIFQVRHRKNGQTRWPDAGSVPDSPLPCELRIERKRKVLCSGSRYLHTCRVKIIDSDKFPSNVYREQIEEGREGIEQIPVFSLLSAAIFCPRIR